MKNRKLKQALIVAVGAAVGLGAGFGIRAALMAGDAPTGDESSSIATAPDHGAANSPSNAARAAKADPKPDADQESIDLSMSSGVTRWLHWMAALENATLSDFPRLARTMAENRFALSMLAERWIDEDPGHMFESLVDLAMDRSGSNSYAHDLMNRLMNEWPKRDPKAVAAALSDSSSPAAKNWRQRVISPLVNSDPELGLQMFHDWNITSYGPHTHGIKDWARRNPQHAAEYALARPAGFATETAIKAIGEVWGESDPAGAVAFAASTPGKYARDLGDAVIRQWAKRDLAAAGEWLESADAAARRSMAPGFLEIFAAQNPTAALEWCGEHLDERAVPNAVGAIVKSMASKDVAEAANLVGGLEPSKAKAEAALEIATAWLPEYEKAGQVPDEAVAWLRQLDSDSLSHVLDRTAWRWVSSDLDGFVDFLASADTAASSAYGVAANALARQDPQRGAEWLENLPPSAAGSAADSFFRAWHEAQPAKAMAWLAARAERGNPDDAITRSALSGIVLHPEGAERLRSLPDSLRDHARTVIEESRLAPDGKAPLLDALADGANDGP